MAWSPIIEVYTDGESIEVLEKDCLGEAQAGEEVFLQAWMT